MAAPSTWLIYNDFTLNTGKESYNLSSDTLMVALVTSASNAISQTLHPATYSALTYELSTANGYTATGQQPTTTTWTGGGASTASTLALGNVSWNITGSGVTFRAAVLYDSITGYLIGYFLADSTPADYSVTAGQTLTMVLGNPLDVTRS